MAVPAAKVRLICTEAEVTLVRASRRPELEQLSHAEVKRHAVRARKLFDKSQDVARNQARVRSREVGYGALAANSQLKIQIFRDALDAFEARLLKLDPTAAKADPSSKPKPKKLRSAEQRASRAAVRKGLSFAEDLHNIPKQTLKPVAVKAPAKPKPQPATQPPTKPAAKALDQPLTQSPADPSTPPAPASRPAKSAAVPKPRPIKTAGIQPSKQLKASAAAKKSRMVSSGKTTRLLGHIAARGKHNQARRDAKN